jgi:hypothetical protein
LSPTIASASFPFHAQSSGYSRYTHGVFIEFPPENDGSECASLTLDDTPPLVVCLAGQIWSRLLESDNLRCMPGNSNRGHIIICFAGDDSTAENPF